MPGKLISKFDRKRFLVMDLQNNIENIKQKLNQIQDISNKMLKYCKEYAQNRDQNCLENLLKSSEEIVSFLKILHLKIQIFRRDMKRIREMKTHKPVMKYISKTNAQSHKQYLQIQACLRDLSAMISAKK